jgi:hypothetical protein
MGSGMPIGDWRLLIVIVMCDCRLGFADLGFAMSSISDPRLVMSD